MKLSLDLPRTLLLILSGCFSYSGAAEPGDRTQGEATGSAAENHEFSAGEEGFPRHNLNLLLRYTFEGSESGLTTGFEYEYRFRHWVGIGGMVEYIAGDINVGVVGVMANFHPWRELVLVIGPGVEFNSQESELFLRMGALYEFEVGPMFLGPAVIVDTFRGNEHALTRILHEHPIHRQFAIC